MKTFKTALSLFLALCMVMSLGGVTAFADIEVVTSEEGTGPQLGILEGEATISYTDSSGGPHVPPDPGVSITDPVVPDPAVPPLDPGDLNLGSVTALAADEEIGNVSKTGEGPVVGVIVADAEKTGAYSRYTVGSTVGTTEGAPATVSVKSIEAKSTGLDISGGGATGLIADSSNAEITVNGNITAQYTGGKAGSSEGALVIGPNTVTVYGDINAAVTSSVNPNTVVGINVGGIADDITRVTLNGDVSAKTTGNQVYGIQTNGSFRSDVEVTVNGNVTATGSTGDNSAGVMASVGTVTVQQNKEGEGGNVTGSGNGVQAFWGATVEVEGNVTGETGNGVNALNGSTVNVGGAVTGGSTGVNATGGSTVTVGTTDENGSFTGGNVSGTTGGIIADNSTVTAGDVTSSNGVGVTASSSGSGSTVTITVGTVKSGDDGIQASGEGTTVNAGNVTAENGIGIKAEGESSVTAGDVEAGSTGISAENSTVTAGNVTTTGETAVAVNVTGSKVEVKDVTGGMTGIIATGDSNVKAGKVEGDSGIMANGSTVSAESVTATNGMGILVEEKGNVMVSGDVTTEGSTAVRAIDSTVNVDGSVSGSSRGVNASDNAEVTVGGDVKATGDGIGVNAFDGAAVEVAGNVTGDIGVYAYEGASVTAGSVTGDDTGVSATNEGTKVTVTGTVTSTGGTGIEAHNGSTVTAGNVTGTTGIKVDGGTVKAENVTATNGNGVEVNGAGTVTIDGTLTVTGGTPILLGDAVTESEAGNINITVWEIQGQAADGSVVSGGQEGAAKAVQKNIDYVIKVAPDETSQSVFSSYQTGDTMNSGKQQIKVTVPENYRLKAAFATDGTTVEITEGEDGNYYAMIPTGGGIYLHAEIEQSPEPEPDPGPVNPDPEPKPEPQPQPEPEFVVYISVVDSIPATPAAPRATGTDAFDAFMQAKLAAVKAAPANGVVEIDLRETGWTNLKRDIFEAAANRGDVTIVIYYRQWGQDHTLTIPAGTQLNDVVSQAQYLDVTQLGTLLNLRAV